jgi:hypothetical protein
MTDVATLLAEFVDALHAGSLPDAGAFLARAESDEARKELATGIETVLDFVPEEVRHPRDESGAYVLGVPAERIAEAVRVTWPAAMPYWRERAKLSVEELAAAALRAGGIDGGAENVASAGRWIAAMESGAESIRTISLRARAALAEALGIAREAFDEAGDFSTGGALAFRADGNVYADRSVLELSELADQLNDALPPGSAVDEFFSA